MHPLLGSVVIVRQIGYPQAHRNHDRQKTEQEMLRTKNFGRKSLNEIKEILHGMGLRLGMRVDFDALEREAALQSGGIEKDATQS